MMRMNVKKLINLVYARPALWDQKHDDYNNKYYLKQLWEEIGEEMDCTGRINLMLLIRIILNPILLLTPVVQATTLTTMV